MFIKTIKINKFPKIGSHIQQMSNRKSILCEGVIDKTEMEYISGDPEAEQVDLMAGASKICSVQPFETVIRMIECMNNRLDTESQRELLERLEKNIIKNI